MNESLARHITAALAPFQSDALLSSSALKHIDDEVASGLPAAMSRFFGFECRLGDAAPVADFLVRTGADAGECESQWRALEAHARSRDGEAWARIARFVAGRHDPACAWHGAIENVWLEFDLASGDASAVPSVFFGTDRLRASREVTAGPCCAWALEAVSALKGHPLERAAGQTFRAVMAALPERARIFQVGMMLSREASPVRICVSDVEPEALPGLLRDLGWPGEMAPVARALRELVPATRYLALGLDAGPEGLGPKLGLEIHPDRDARRFLALIDTWRRAGLVTAHKSAGLIAWNGITHERRHREVWPADLLDERAARPGGESSTFCRYINHFKLAFAPRTPPSLKAYLGVRHAFLTDAAIRTAMLPAA